jgi:hypothetical protein
MAAAGQSDTELETEWHILSKDFTQFIRQRCNVKVYKEWKTNRRPLCSNNHDHGSNSEAFTQAPLLPIRDSLNSGKENDQEHKPKGTATHLNLDSSKA